MSALVPLQERIDVDKSEVPPEVVLKKHRPKSSPGYIYCVYDEAVDLVPGAVLQVKCGKTVREPTGYCIRTYARHMGKLVVACLASVSDTTLAESLLFRILDTYRVNHKHEVFAVESIHIVVEAFEDLVSVLGVMGRKNPNLSGRIMPVPETKVIDSANIPETGIADSVKLNKAQEHADKRAALKLQRLQVKEAIKLEKKEKRRLEQLQRLEEKQKGEAEEVRRYLHQLLDSTGNDSFVSQADIYRAYLRCATDARVLSKGAFFPILKSCLGSECFKMRHGSSRARNVYVGWILKNKVS